jgi:predicted enzyme related to lactoylglutathione lyase
MAQAHISHIEFPADDTDRAQRFYSELFGWEFQEMEGYGGYFMFSSGAIEQSGGAIGLRGQSTGDTVRVYITCDSIDDVLPRVEELGGKVVTPRTDIPGQGWYAVILDSEGSELGLYENLPSD